jgi:hypothetical protein
VNRVTRIFLAALVCSVAMLGTGSSIRPGIDDGGVMLEMLRFILFVGGGAAAVAVWATALFAAVHHVIWPLVLALVMVAGSALAFALT